MTTLKKREWHGSPVCPGCHLPVSIERVVTVDGAPCHPKCAEWVIKPSEPVRLV